MSNSEEKQQTPQNNSDDEAPEAVSISDSKTQALIIKKKEREVQQELMKVKKRKRREIDAKLKEQKRHKIAKLLEESSISVQSDAADSRKKIDNIVKKINEEGLPKFLPTELLEDFYDDKKRKRKQPKEHKQVKLKKSKMEPQIKKKKTKEQPNTGLFTVVALQDPDLDKPTPIPKGIMEFKEDHFYGERLPRKNAILNASQGRKGAAIKFCRK